MSVTSEGQFSPFGETSVPGPPSEWPPLPDAAARIFATNPANNVVLEASAGTGKTTVLVTRYVNLLRVGVDPSNILAMTFTRQAAAEMRERCGLGVLPRVFEPEALASLRAERVDRQHLGSAEPPGTATASR